MMRPSLLSDRRNPLRLVRSAPAPAEAAQRDGVACARVWAAVLLQAHADARHAKHREAVKSWLDSADFVRLCDLCGVDAAHVRRAIERELLLPVRERNEYRTRKLGYVRKRKASIRGRALAFDAAGDGR